MCIQVVHVNYPLKYANCDGHISSHEQEKMLIIVTNNLRSWKKKIKALEQETMHIQMLAIDILMWTQASWIHVHVGTL